MQTDIRITRLSEEVGTDGRGRPVPMVRIEYMVKDQGPFIHRLPAEGFTAAAARQAIEARAREILNLLTS
jgi:hypothetical protein